MKVVHIMTMDDGGAGICAGRIHKVLLHRGEESVILTAHRSNPNPSMQEIIAFSIGLQGLSACI